MTKSTISLGEIANRILLERRLMLMIESAAGAASSIQSKVLEFGKELKAAGEDPTDEEAQAALLMAALDKGGNLDKVDVEDAEKAAKEISESRGYTLNESGGVFHTIELVGNVLGNVALLNVISKAVEKITGKKVDASKMAAGVNKFTSMLKKLTGLPAKALEKFFMLISKKLGGGDAAQKVAGYAGTIIVVAAFFVIGALWFPVLGASPLMIVLSLTGLIGKGFEMGQLWKELKHAIKDYKAEGGKDADKLNLAATA